MGKKNRNKRRDDKNAKSKAKPSNDEKQKKAETTEKIEPRIVIEIDASTPESPNKIATYTTMNNLDGDINKLFDTVVSRIDIGAKVATQAIKAIVEVEGGRFDDSMKKATIEIINEKLTQRILEMQWTTPTETRTNSPHFQVDENGRAWLVNGNIDKMTNQSNANGNASTAALVPVPATASGSGTTADQSGMKRVFDTVKGQKMQRLDSVVSEASTNNSDPLPVDSDFGEQSDCQSEQAYNADILNESSDTVHDDYARMYHCLHCQLKLAQHNQFETFKQVYSHWEREHNNQLRTLPFYFYTTEYGNCAYCDHVGTYWELEKHQSKKHPSFPLAITDIINCEKCALCSYIGKDVPAHSQVHRIYRKNFSRRHIARMTNPLSYTDETYDERLLLRIHQKHRCLECGLAFDTAFLQRQHFLFRHQQSAQSLLKCNAKIFYDNSRHMICGCCCAQIPWNGFFEHIKTVTFEYPCEKCSFTFLDLVDLIVHDRTDHNINNSTFMRTSQLSNRLKKYYQSTRIVHGNGLVITRQNILSTKFDDWPEFSDYIEGLIETVKSRLKEMKFFEMGRVEPKKRNKMSQTVVVVQNEIEKSGLSRSHGNASIHNDDKTKTDADDKNGESSGTNTSMPKPPKTIAYKRLSKGAGARILCEKVIEKEPTPTKSKKKAKPNKKTNQTNETDHGGQSVITRSTQTGDSTTSV